MSEMPRVTQYLKYTIIVLAILLIVLALFFVMDYRTLHRAEVISNIHRGVPLTATDVSIIRPWMTFDYINRIFGLPSDYLKTHLSITDPAYPHTSLTSYASYARVNSAIVTDQIEGAIYDHLTNPAR